MTLLDMHIWIWLVNGDKRLLQEYFDYIQNHESERLSVSTISCLKPWTLVQEQGGVNYARSLMETGS
jgi:PIN domain nuclease of toxin-antitoxin system